MADAEIIRLDSRTRGASDRSPQRCQATTKSGRPCRNYTLEGADYCRVHQRRTRPKGAPAPTKGPTPARDEDPLNVSSATSADDSPVDRARAFLRRRLGGDYPIDDFGYDEELSRAVLLPLV